VAGRLGSKILLRPLLAARRELGFDPQFRMNAD